jgi:hypothetical protein
MNSRSPQRVALSYSLRTLLIGVTALALWLGYEVNWIHQRHAFLASQFEHHLAVAPVPSEQERRDWVGEWWRQKTGTNRHVPWSLRLFGELGVVNVSVIVPETDITIRTWGYDNAELPVEWPEISASQPDYRRAKRLFPEAQILPVRPEEWSIEYRGGEMSDWLRPLIVREQASQTTVRLVCDSTVVERRDLNCRTEIIGHSDGPVIVDYATSDGTGTARQGNVVPSDNRVFFRPGQTSFPSHFSVAIGWLTEEQRAAGGASFKITLGTIVGASPGALEKTIMIVPASNSEPAANREAALEGR